MVLATVDYSFAERLLRQGEFAGGEMGEREKPSQCDCCLYETDELKMYRCGLPSKNAQMWLCMLCANSMAGTVYEYPQLYPEQGKVVSCIMNAANHILAEIRKKRV